MTLPTPPPAPPLTAPPTLRPTSSHTPQHHSAHHHCSDTHQHASQIIHASIPEDAPLAVEGGEFIRGWPTGVFPPPDYCTSPQKNPMKIILTGPFFFLNSHSTPTFFPDPPYFSPLSLKIHSAGHPDPSGAPWLAHTPLPEGVCPPHSTPTQPTPAWTRLWVHPRASR